MGFELGLDNLTFKHMDTLRTQIQSVARRLCFEPLFLDMCNMKEIFKKDHKD